MGVTTFKGINDISDTSSSHVVRDNLILYLDWAFLEAGAFFNINIPTSGAYGGNREKLRRVEDPRYTPEGRVWEGQRKNWIWESGLSRADQPIHISGLFINNTFLPLNSGYYIDYPNGRVVFDRPVPANSSVKIEHSYKWVHVCSPSQMPDVLQVQDRSFRSDDSKIPVSSGHWQRLADTRVQLPAVTIQTSRVKNEGFELGGGSFSRIDVLIDVIAEDENTATKIGNILSNQKESTLFLFDVDRLAENNAYPLDYRGSLNENGKTYPELIATTGDGGYRYTDKIQNGKMFISESESQGTDRINNNIFHCPVTMTIELIVNNI